MNDPKQRYFMEDTREASRLSSKVDPDAWVARYLDRFLETSKKVLDIGCGPGVIASAVANAAPHAQVFGMDQSEARIDNDVNKNIPANCELRSGNAVSLPFDSDEFDLIYCRFMLEYVQERQRAIEEMVRVCRPGGRVLLQDLDGQLIWHYPLDQELEHDIELVLQSLASTGFDPFVGRKLYHLAWQAGLRDIDVTVESYHLYAGKIDAENDRLWELKLDIALPTVAKALGSEQRAQSLKSRFMNHLRREDTLTYSVVFTVTGTKPTMG